LSAAFSSGAFGQLAWISLASMAIYVGFFAIVIGPLFWLLNSEIFRSPARPGDESGDGGQIQLHPVGLSRRARGPKSPAKLYSIMELRWA
jgi:hypothetical protein